MSCMCFRSLDKVVFIDSTDLEFLIDIAGWLVKEVYTKCMYKMDPQIPSNGNVESRVFNCNF